MISIKSPREIDIMRRCGKMLATAHKALKDEVKAGITTKDLDKIAEKVIRDQGGKPAFLGYRGFPATACISVNDEVVHGIPSNRVINDGDLVSIDLGVLYEGYYTDAARTWIVGGKASNRIKALVATAELAVYQGAWPYLSPDFRLGDVCAGIQKVIEDAGFGIVREFVGHGIGRQLHEDPQVPNFGKKGTGIKLEAGMVLAIEPMVTERSHEVQILDDDWTVTTKDGGLASHYEDSIVITENGPEAITSWKES